MALTSASATQEPALDRFQALLWGIFRFDTEDLDFGIYRVLNAKRDDVRKFIDDELPKVVEGAMEKHASDERGALRARLSGLQSQAIATLGQPAVDEGGNISAQYASTPLGRQISELKASIDAFVLAEDTRASIFNDLYRFFSRYYLDGDFVPARRYGREDAYVVPYHGENVFLYWANRDQYFAKTDDSFRAYSFRAGNGRISFLLNTREDDLVDAVADDDGPTTKNRFVLLQDDPISWDQNERLLRVHFIWRSLHESEAHRYSGTQRAKVQSQINDAIARSLLDSVVKLEAPSAALGGPDTLERLLSTHVSRFTRRNTADFFVHRDLGGFLTRELDFFIQHDVLSLDDILREAISALQLSRARAVREIGSAVIAFLAQIENLQRRLFEKPKLVLTTDYCITIDRLSDGVVAEAIASKAQRAEWSRAFSVSVDDETEPDALRERNPHVVVDTRHFDESFKWRLLGEIDDVDASLDGVLIKSDAFHALRVLTPRYRDSVQSTYIDPPFNTETSQFLYRDSYRDSCWLTLLANRLEASRPLLRKDAAVFVHLDENSNYYGRFLLDAIFGRSGFRDEIVWRIGWGSGYKVRAPSFVRNHETILMYGAKGKPFFAKERMGIPYRDVPISEVEEAVTKIVESFGLETPKFARQRLAFLSSDGTVYKVTEGKERKSGTYWIEDTWNANEYEQLDSNKIKRNAAEYTPNGSLLTQKPEQLLQRVIVGTTNETDFVLDFFAGSGTTAAVAKKLGRRFLAVEPGQYFETDVVWRMKQVLAGKQVGISRMVGHVGGGFFKYQILESYEDALENVSFDSSVASVGQGLFGSAYLIRYSFDSEARGDAALPESVLDPFAVRLRLSGTNAEESEVDLVETFNALSGIRVIRYLALEAEGVVYRVVLGDQSGKRWVVIWRTLDSWDAEALARDRDTLKTTVLPSVAGDHAPDQIYVNGECVLEGAESADALLNRLLAP